MTDYTAQKYGPYHLDLKPDLKLKVEIIYYNRIDSIGVDGLHTFTLDSIIYTNKDETLRRAKED